MDSLTPSETNVRQMASKLVKKIHVSSFLLSMIDRQYGNSECEEIKIPR